MGSTLDLQEDMSVLGCSSVRAELAMWNIVRHLCNLGDWRNLQIWCQPLISARFGQHVSRFALSYLVSEGERNVKSHRWEKDWARSQNRTGNRPPRNGGRNKVRERIGKKSMSRERVQWIKRIKEKPMSLEETSQGRRREGGNQLSLSASGTDYPQHLWLITLSIWDWLLSASVSDYCQNLWLITVSIYGWLLSTFMADYCQHLWLITVSIYGWLLSTFTVWTFYLLGRCSMITQIYYL